jgi:hypothetical protein
MWKKLSGNKVTIQVGLRIYCADRNKIESWRYPAHRKAISNGWIRNSSMGYLNCYVIQCWSKRAEGTPWPYRYRKGGVSAMVSKAPYGAGLFQRNRNGLWIR